MRLRPDGRPRIVPSLLSADFGRLAQALRLVEGAGADWASVDVMDGHFVPNLSFGPDHVKALRRSSGMFLDAHLMVQDPRFFAPLFIDAGADLVTAHLEACRRPRALLKDIRARGASAGLALKPATPASAALPYLKDADMLLVMTVEPGFGGRTFMKDMLSKIRTLREAIDRAGAPVWLMVDGGVRADTVAAAAAAGADALVAGSAVFGTKDPAASFKILKRAAEEAFRREAAAF